MKNKKRSGISLLELVVALGILLIIAVPLGNMFFFSTRTNVQVHNFTMASLTAQLVIEEFTGISREQFENRFGHDLASGINFPLPPRHDWNGFDVYINFEPHNEHDVLVHLTVDVSSIGGEQHFVSHDTIINIAPQGLFF